jgi:hypothetical protein
MPIKAAAVSGKRTEMTSTRLLSALQHVARSFDQ